MVAKASSVSAPASSVTLSFASSSVVSRDDDRVDAVDVLQPGDRLVGLRRGNHDDGG